jgi:branched-chain amino acid transport system permease protein
LIFGLVTGGIYSLVALSFTIIYKTVRFFHFAHGVVLTTGAYCIYTLAIIEGLSVSISFILTVSFCAILGIAINKIVYYPLRKSNAPNLVLAIASFGVFIFIQNLLQLLYGAQILTLRTGPVKEGHQIMGGAVITDIQRMFPLKKNTPTSLTI